MTAKAGSKSQPVRGPWVAVAVLAACSATGTRESLGTHDPGAPRSGAGGTGGSGVSASGGSGGSGTGGSASVGSGLDGGGERDSGICASADVQVARVVPTVWLVVEITTSMQIVVEGRTLWETAREALLGPQGAVSVLQSAIAFGAVLHGYAEPLSPTCPDFVTTEATLNNFAGIARVLPAQYPRGFVPLTARALEHVLTQIPKGDAGDPAAAERIVVLVKSGGPDFGCDGVSDDQTGRKVEAAKRLAAVGARIFVMSLQELGGALPSSPTDAEVARIGNTGFGVFTPQNQAQIPMVLGQFLREQVSCEVVLNGTVTAGSECQGSVKVDGALIPCNDPNGWRLKNDRTVELVGAACSDLRAKPQANVRADFPCKVFRPIPS